MKNVHLLSIVDIQKLVPPKTRPRDIFLRTCSSGKDADLTRILEKLIDKDSGPAKSPIKHQQLRCLICSKFYAGRANLRSHLKYVHKKNIEERKQLIPYPELSQHTPI